MIKLFVLLVLASFVCFGQTTVVGGAGGGTPCSDTVTTNCYVKSGSDGTVAITATVTAGSLQTGNGGGVAGLVSVSQGTAPTIPANSFGFAAPTSITASVFLQPPNASPSAHSVMVIGSPASNVAAFAYKVIPDCTDTGGNHLNFTQSTDAFSCGTSGGAAGAAILANTQTFIGLNTFQNASGITIKDAGPSGTWIRMSPSGSVAGLAQIYTDYASSEGPLALGTYTNRANQLYMAVAGGVSIGMTNTAGAGQFLVLGLKTTGAATGKNVVCVDTSTGQLYASSAGNSCAN